MISHLYNSYGFITALEIMQNEKQTDKPYNPSEAMETYFDQIEDTVKFAEAGNSPFTNTQIVTKAFIQMFATGLYKDEYRAWNQLLVPARTCQAFKTIFLAANKEVREMQALAGNIIFSNNVTQGLFEQTARPLSTIVKTIATYQEAVANVATNTASIATQLQDTINAMNNIRARLNEIKSNAHNANGNSGCICTLGGGSINQLYCNTHGRTRCPDHTRKTCRNKAEGHVSTTTLHNRQSGSSRS